MEDQEVDGTTILRWMLGRWVESSWWLSEGHTQQSTAIH